MVVRGRKRFSEICIHGDQLAYFKEKDFKFGEASVSFESTQFMISLYWHMQSDSPV